MSNTFTTNVKGRMSSRGWAIALGVGAIVLAAVLLVVYLDRYRARVSGENAPTPVLVAKQLIPQGTPGSIVASSAMYQATTVPQKDVQVGAISDPSYLAGRAAASNVFPGQQLTTTAFAAEASGSVESQITGAQRAISVSIDNVHGSLGELQAGDSIDLYIGLGARNNGQQVVKLFRPNVKVLTVPGSGTTGWRQWEPRAPDGHEGRCVRSPTWPTTRRCTSCSARSWERSRRPTALLPSIRS